MDGNLHWLLRVWPESCGKASKFFMIPIAWNSSRRRAGIPEGRVIDGFRGHKHFW
jgi:hypothetical protein